MLALREVFFEINGIPRVVEVVDTSEDEGSAGGAKKAAREKADSSKVGSVAAPMAGEVVDVQVTPGAHARALHAAALAIACMASRTLRWAALCHHSCVGIWGQDLAGLSCPPSLAEGR